MSENWPLALSIAEQRKNRFFKPPSSARSELFNATPSGLFIHALLAPQPAFAGGTHDAPKTPEGVTQTTYYYHCENTDTLIQENLATTKECLDTILNTVLPKYGSAKYNSWIEKYVEVPSYGYTYSAFIGKSAVTIHTWPEHGTVTLDINVCDLETDEADIDAMVNELVAEFKTFFGSEHTVNLPRTRAPLTLPE